MGVFGMMGLLLAFAGAGISILSLITGHILKRKSVGETLSWAGRTAAIVAFVALTLTCVLMAYCFVVGNVSIQYVLDNHVNSTGFWGTFYRISGLWAGREGSLLFWAWLISLFGMLVSARRMDKTEPLDNIATLIIQLVLIAFIGIMLFSTENNPFTATSETYFNDDGTLTDAAQLLGMNSLLQHWAMAIHPPMLFLGYAGLTVPFAYGISACVVNKADQEWVLRSERYALAAWMFLTLGIGLGSVWAYVVLGWGGYWGWDPVENASLLPWLASVALIHSFTVYKKRGMFKSWAVMSASLAFCFCIVGTFISRSGLVQSVHAFEGDSVSLALFGSLIIVSVLMGVVGCLARRKSFATEDKVPEAESMVSKDGTYFINNVLMILLAFLLAYLTIAQALPDFLPFGGQSVATGTYEIVSRPVGALYLLMMAVCPLLSWCKTDPKAFVRRARIPGICALVLFVLLAIYWATVLVPSYDAVVAAGDSNSELILEQGPAPYYNGLALFSFLVAALLVFNSGYQLVRVIKSAGKRKGTGVVARLGSCVSHLAVGVILIGLVGSSMYVTEISGYMPYDSDAHTGTERFVVKDYELEYVDESAGMANNYQDVEYAIEFDVYKDGNYLGRIKPMVTLVTTTQQQKYTAGVISLPQEDLFVVYQGLNSEGTGISLDVRINPLISFVWVGMVLLAIGMFMSTVGRRNGARRKKKEPATAGIPAGEPATAGGLAGDPATAGGLAGESATAGIPAGETATAGELVGEPATAGIPAGETATAGELVGETVGTLSRASEADSRHEAACQASAGEPATEDAE